MFGGLSRIIWYGRDIRSSSHQVLPPACPVPPNQGNVLCAWEVQSADWRRSATRTTPREELYIMTLHCVGWKDAHVITSLRSSMLGGFRSTMSGCVVLGGKGRGLVRGMSVRKGKHGV